MKQVLYISFILLVLSLTLHASSDDHGDVRRLHIDFDRSMHVHTKSYKDKFINNFTNQKYIIFLRNLYEKNNLKTALFSTKSLIPLKIHQILVGNRDLPDSFYTLQNSWQLYHPEWEYILWTDEKVKELQLKNQKLYDETNDPFEKANILRYEILYQFGGLCVDVGTECVRSFEPLHHRYNFYTGIAPLACKGVMNTGLIAAAVGNLIIEECLRRLPSKVHEKERTHRNGSAFFSEVFYSMAHSVPGTVIAFPPSYFSPSHPELIKTSSKDIKPESFALYYWSSLPSETPRMPLIIAPKKSDKKTSKQQQRSSKPGASKARHDDYYQEDTTDDDFYDGDLEDWIEFDAWPLDDDDTEDYEEIAVVKKHKHHHPSRHQQHYKKDYHDKYAKKEGRFKKW